MKEKHRVHVESAAKEDKRYSRFSSEEKALFQSAIYSVGRAKNLPIDGYKNIASVKNDELLMKCIDYLKVNSEEMLISQLHKAYKNEKSRSNRFLIKALEGAYDNNNCPANVIKSSKSSWPDWEPPSEESMLFMAKTLTKHIKFLKIEVINELVKDNAEKRVAFTNKLKELQINPDVYIWYGGSCVFPGIRRHAGKLEIEEKRQELSKGKFKDALYLDDNDYPKHIWAYLLTGKEFKITGPNDYQLAHILDHKVYRNRTKSQFEFENDAIFPGLFTSATNLCYVPTALMKPTDSNTKLRNLIFYKAFSLYKSVSNLLPRGFDIPEQQKDEWHISNFEWDPVLWGDMNKMGSFLTFRENEMNRLFEICRQKTD